eukprot:824169-Prorocentrum_minimum.AAC.3
MSLLADVRVEMLHANGTVLRAKTGRSLQVEAAQDDDGRSHLHVPFKPLGAFPGVFKLSKGMKVWAANLKDGKFTIRLPGQMNGQIAQVRPD